MGVVGRVHACIHTRETFLGRFLPRLPLLSLPLLLPLEEEEEEEELESLSLRVGRGG